MAYFRIRQVALIPVRTFSPYPHEKVPADLNSWGLFYCKILNFVYSFWIKQILTSPAILLIYIIKHRVTLLTMNVYFIRHGETVSNTNKTIQGPDDTLTERGIKEAHMLAERIKNVNFDLAISSPLIRCTQTAEVYSHMTHADYSVNELFTELRPNSALIGKTREHTTVVQANSEYQNNEHNEDWKLNDEESFAEFRKRAVEALSYLQALSSKENTNNVLVFTHGKFLRALVGVILFGAHMTKAEYKNISDTFYIQNASITKLIFKKSDGAKTDRWRIVHWNDCSHILG